MNQEEAHIKLQIAIDNYVSGIDQEWRERWNAWSVDLTKKEVTEVIFGIVSRQVTIVSHYTKAPSFWNGDLAPIVLRSLVDNYINFAWILCNPDDRCKQFVMHGLGQVKLAMEHTKVQLEKDGIDPEKHPLYKSAEEWLTWQRYPFLTTVNLGSWSALNTRKMAEEAGCIDLYNYVYQPFSTSTHSMWNHISRYNLIQSENPLHTFLLTPTINDWPAELNYLELGAKYLGRMFDMFDKTFKHNSVTASSYQELQRQVAAIQSTLEMPGDHQANTEAS